VTENAMRRSAQWIAFSLLTALSACDDEVLQLNFPTDASADRAEGGSSRGDAGTSADGASPTSDAAAADEAPPAEAQTGDEAEPDDGGERAGD
jgi:hypothetical protein